MTPLEAERDRLMQRATPAIEAQPQADPCPVCGSLALQPLRCKVICRGCRTIIQSCADL